MNVGWLLMNVGWLLTNVVWLLMTVGWLLTNVGWLLTNVVWLLMNVGWLLTNVGWLLTKTSENCVHLLCRGKSVLYTIEDPQVQLTLWAVRFLPPPPLIRVKRKKVTLTLRRP
jgi:hypothetical protein